MFTNHWTGPDGGDRYDPTLFDVDLAQWHTYGLEWTPNRLTMTLDGKVIKILTDNIPHQNMAIGLQGHVGAANEEWYGGSPNGSGVTHLDIAVDSIRYFEYVG
jgi:beta-glucanase (GH16 family)